MNQALEIYAVNIPARLEPLLLGELLHRLEAEKAQRIRQFRQEEDKIRTLTGGLLIRYLIRKKKGIDNHDIIFAKNEFDKPYLIGVKDFHFNISHAGDWVTVAIDCQPVGIDVERIQYIEPDMSEHAFSREEHQDIQRHDDPKSYFFTLWALKESYIKWLGRGTDYPLDAFHIKVHHNNRIELKIGGKLVENVYFSRYFIDSGYKCAVCSGHNHFPQRVNFIAADRLYHAFS